MPARHIASTRPVVAGALVELFKAALTSGSASGDGLQHVLARASEPAPPSSARSAYRAPWAPRHARGTATSGRVHAPMPPFPRALPMVAAALSIAACAAASSRTWPGSQPVRITDPTRRIQFRGFSVLPPTGPGWFAMLPVPADPAPIYLVARFAKVVDHADTPDVHTTEAEVHIWDVGWRMFAGADDFLQFEKEQAERLA